MGWLWFLEKNTPELNIGELAPEFSLQDQNGQNHSLAQYRGKWVVVYFYPKDDTPGCTQEACHFRDDFVALRSLDVQVLGISLDSSASHDKFAKKYNLPFPLLADETAEVTHAYGSLFKLGPLKFAKRHSFIIDPQGKIAKVYRSVDTATHSEEIVVAVKQLRR